MKQDYEPKPKKDNKWKDNILKYWKGLSASYKPDKHHCICTHELEVLSI